MNKKNIYIQSHIINNVHDISSEFKSAKKQKKTVSKTFWGNVLAGIVANWIWLVLTTISVLILTCLGVSK